MKNARCTVEYHVKLKARGDWRPLPNNSHILIRAHVETVLGNVNELKNPEHKSKEHVIDLAVILVTKEVTFDCKFKNSMSL